MSLYADYIKEREGYDTIETEHGFATYLIQGISCYLRDIYVTPSQRQSRVAWELADKVTELAKAAGCRFMTGSVSLLDPAAERNAKVLKAYGFKYNTQDGDLSLFVKEIK